MPTKKVKVELKEKANETAKNSRYYYAVGRRKTAVAKVKLYKSGANQSTLMVNDKKIDEYFSLARLREMAKNPLALAGEGLNFDVTVKVLGGGISAQAEAVRLGIARALVVFDSELKKSLKDKGFLTRDPRKVERKKAGLKKARRAPQWAKR